MHSPVYSTSFSASRRERDTPTGAKLPGTGEILMLPDHVIEEIFNRMEFAEVSNTRRVCRRFRDVGANFFTHYFRKLQGLIQKEIRLIDDNWDPNYLRNYHNRQCHLFLEILESDYNITSVICWQATEDNFCPCFAGELLQHLYHVFRIYVHSRKTCESLDGVCFERIFELNEKLIWVLERVLENMDDERNFLMDAVHILDWCLTAERKDETSLAENACVILFSFKVNDAYLFFTGRQCVKTKCMRHFKHITRALVLLVCMSNREYFRKKVERLSIGSDNECFSTVFSNKRITFEERMFMFGCKMQGKDESCVTVQFRFSIPLDQDEPTDACVSTDIYRRLCEVPFVSTNVEIQLTLNNESSYNTSLEYKRSLTLYKVPSSPSKQSSCKKHSKGGSLDEEPTFIIVNKGN